MISLLFIIAMTVIAVQVTKEVLRNKEVFEEFGQTKKILFLVYLFPLAPVILLVGGYYMNMPIVYILASICFLPALILARKQDLAFQMAGTSKVKDAKEVISKVNTSGIVGLIIIGVTIVFNLVKFGFNS